MQLQLKKEGNRETV